MKQVENKKNRDADNQSGSGMVENMNHGAANVKRIIRKSFGLLPFFTSGEFDMQKKLPFLVAAFALVFALSTACVTAADDNQAGDRQEQFDCSNGGPGCGAR